MHSEKINVHLSSQGEERLSELHRLLYKKIGGMDPELAQSYLDQLKQLANQYNRQDMLVWSEIFQSDIEQYKAQPEACMDSLKRALAMSERVDDPAIHIEIYKLMGYTHSLFYSDYDKALSLYEQSLQIAQNNNLSLHEGRIYDSIGVTYQALSKHYLANQCFQKAIKLYKKVGEEHLIANSLHNMALWYNDHEKAIELLKKAAVINAKYGDAQRLFLNHHLIGVNYKKLSKIDEALEHAQKAIELVESINIPVYKMLAWYAIGELTKIKATTNKTKTNKNLLAEAQKYSDQLSPQAEVLGIADFKVRAFSLKGKIAYYQGNVEQGLTHLLQADDIVKSADSYIDDGIRLDMLRYIHKLYAELENYKSAYEYHIRFHELKHEITSASGRKDVQELQTQYETEQKEAEVARLQEMEALKTRFFSQITHELRTPLTLIIGPTRQILEQATEPAIQMNAGIIDRNADRLLQLVNQLLDIGKLEAGKMSLNKNYGILSLFVESIIYAFQGLAKQQQIQLDLINEIDEITAKFDASAIEKILFNLLSNAFKFTDRQGRIVCCLTAQNTDDEMIKNLTINLMDTGKGIKAEELPYIFDRFYQADGSYTREYEGTGIGLSLVKELVELMEGSIDVKSIFGEGTEFIINIPIEIAQQESQVIKGQPQRKQGVVSQPLIPDRSNTLIDADALVLLLIEDNKDMHEYIRSVFENDYVILQSYNGDEGIHMAKERIPDLIISDVMMPEKDGYQVCDELKHDMLTSHIPIILLTAKTALNSRIEAYRKKADAYLSKPFNPEELKERVKGLISIRHELQKKYSIAAPKEEPANPESVFLRRVNEVIIAELNNPNFGPMQLTESLFLSRSQLFRKIKALTGRSTSAFIRSIRLLKGLELLKNTELSITQIAYEVGFSHASYFTTRFLEEFGYSPSEVRI